MLIINPFEVETLSKLSIAEMEQELDEIMEHSGFIVPPRAAALQDELTKRRRSKINLASLYGKTVTGGIKCGELYTAAAKTYAGRSYLTDRTSLDELLWQAADQEAAELLAITKPFPSFSQQEINAYVADRVALLDSSIKYKSKYYKPSPLDKLSADLEEFGGTTNEWFNQQYLQTATKPEPEAVRRPMDYLGLMSPSDGINPMEVDVGRETIAAQIKRHVRAMEEVWKGLRDITTNTNPTFITAKAPSFDDIQKIGRSMRDHIFDDSIKYMYPTTIKPIDSIIHIATPVDFGRTTEFKVVKERSSNAAGTTFINFDVFTDGV